MPDEDWDTVIDTNLGGVFYTCRAAARGMMKRRGGSIVNLTSVVGIHGNPGQTNYAASKAGIIGFTKSLARELASRGVRANAIAPGYIQTALTDVLPEEAQQAILTNTPLARIGDAGGRGRGGTVPVLRRGLVHHGRGAARRRRTGDVMRRRTEAGVVITGMGAVTPLGNDVETTWENLLAGKSGAGPITQFDSTDYPVTFACELKDFEPTDWLEHKTARRMDRFAQMVVAAARQAERTPGSTSPPMPTGSARRSRPGSVGSSRSRTAPRCSASAGPTG